MRARWFCLFLSASLAVPAWAESKDKAIDPTDWGKVIGRVYDARTGNPLAGAAVCLQQDGGFAAAGSTVGKTDAFGRYECEAMLGRVSSNVDVGRLLGQ